MGSPLLAYIALGANLGNARATVLSAMDSLRQWSDYPLRRSALWRTEPVDCPPGAPPFINAVVGLIPRAGEQPESLLVKLHTLERVFGRPPKQIHNEPRPLDLDLIAFGEERRHTPSLILPHPRAHTRFFVLQPLSELAPDLILPGQSKTVVELLQALPQTPGIWRCEP